MKRVVMLAAAFAACGPLHAAGLGVRAGSTGIGADVAFNVADGCAVAGAVSLVVGAAAFALRHPALLRQPI